MNAVGVDYDLPPHHQEYLRRAARLEWVSIALLVTIVVVMGLVMGSSQTMKAMWVEDILSIVPSISFLVGAHLRKKKPTEAYPYGYRRAVLAGFMCGAVALFGLGVMILFDSLMKLISAEHASVPTVQIFGRTLWLGWLMVAALIYSTIPRWCSGV